LLVFMAVTAAGFYFFVKSPIHQIYLPTATGITAKQVCSLHFISGFTHDRARELYIDPLLGGAEGLISSKVEGNEVRSGILGILYNQRAVYREGIGCSLVHDGARFDASLTLPHDKPFEPLTADTVHRDNYFDPEVLNSAIENAFSEPPGSGRNTLAVVVLHRGRLVAERYAEGVTPATPLHGWSMAKSLTATLAGAMIERGEITLDRQAILDEKALTEDPEKSKITLKHLLQMRAGLNLDEENAGFDPNSRMMFTKADMAAWAARQPLVQEPGEVWDYMSGNSVLAMRAIQNVLPGSVSDHIAAVRERVFKPLRMHTAILETDQAGTLQGGSYLYAAAHDWARLAQLYLDNGMAGDTRILPEGWIELVSNQPENGRQTNRYYGLGFWLGHSGIDGKAFYMSGIQGQAIYILPDHDLLVVRLGATNHTGAGTFDLVADVVNAMR